MFVTVPLLVTPGLALLMVVRMSEDRITPTPGMHGRDERGASTTLDELKGIVLDGFSRTLGDIATTNANVRAIDAKVDEAVVRIDRLETKVFGSKPPPLLPRPPVVVVHSPSALPGTSAPPGHRERAPSLIEKTEATDGELAELSGRVLRLEAEAETIKSINKQQSKAMGLAMPEASIWRKAFALLWSRKGVELVIAVATLASVALGYERAGDALRKVQDAVQHVPAEGMPR